jgi:hypothetical protein
MVRVGSKKRGSLIKDSKDVFVFLLCFREHRSLDSQTIVLSKDDLFVKLASPHYGDGNRQERSRSSDLGEKREKDGKEDVKKFFSPARWSSALMHNLVL